MILAEARGSAQTAHVVTVEEVVRIAVGRAALADAIEGEVAVEDGRARQGRAYPNPLIIYMREQTFGGLGTAEDYLSIAQTVDLGNRRGLHGRAGRTRAEAARAEGDALRMEVAADATLRFYEVLQRQARVAALEQWIENVERALDVVRRREMRGDASTYDRVRLEREHAVGEGRVETERAGLERARARLGALIGREPAALVATGVLPPSEAPRELSTLREASGARPDLLALRLRIDAAALDIEAASRWWAPDLRLEAGWKGVDIANQGRTDGFLFGASLSLPLWDRSSGLTRIAEGEARSARGREALLVSELEGELAGARAETVRLQVAAQTYRAQAIPASTEVVRIALAGYGGGELGLLELLDAYRGAVEDELTALDMELAARRARVDLDRMTGEARP